MIQGGSKDISDNQQQELTKQWCGCEILSLATNTVPTMNYLCEGGVLCGRENSDFVPLSRHHQAGLGLQVEVLLGS